MALITLEEAKIYLRLDSSDEDDLISMLLVSAQQLCADVARLADDKRELVMTEDAADDTGTYTMEELSDMRETLRVAILYALGYLYEHREEADHHDLTLTLRSLLFVIREGVL